MAVLRTAASGLSLRLVFRWRCLNWFSAGATFELPEFRRASPSIRRLALRFAAAASHTGRAKHGKLHLVFGNRAPNHLRCSFDLRPEGSTSLRHRRLKSEDFRNPDRAHFNANYPLLVPLVESYLFFAQGSQQDLGIQLFIRRCDSRAGLNSSRGNWPLRVTPTRVQFGAPVSSCSPSCWRLAKEPVLVVTPISPLQP